MKLYFQCVVIIQYIDKISFNIENTEYSQIRVIFLKHTRFYSKSFASHWRIIYILLVAYYPIYILGKLWKYLRGLSLSGGDRMSGWHIYYYYNVVWVGVVRCVGESRHHSIYSIIVCRALSRVARILRRSLRIINNAFFVQFLVAHVVIWYTLISIQYCKYTALYYT